MKGKCEKWREREREKGREIERARMRVTERRRERERESQRTQERDEEAIAPRPNLKLIISSHIPAQCFGPFRPIRDVPLSLFI